MKRDDSAPLKKELKLMDVFAISTGTMFSSGFFLLPGIAAAQAGPSVILAYFLAGLLILPAMFSAAELCTAMPRAGGSYFFLDRSLGPMAGMVGGLGTYFGLVLKTAFALLGIGAYLAIFADIPIRPLAVGMVILFTILNVMGAKETTTFQRILVCTLIGVLGVFVIYGLWSLAGSESRASVRTRITPFFPFGVEGLAATAGLVFVSYAGLTKVASIAEEVDDPEKTIPRGMMLSLAVTSAIYVLGVAVVVMTLEPADLHKDLTPIATAAQTLFAWVPGNIGVWAIVIAAIAAFASTGNAGLMASSRYPLAMARDSHLPEVLGRLTKSRIPLVSILLTSGLMIFFILVLREGDIAKLASGFQLLIFGLMCLAVIVMRESGLTSYDPGYKSPFYPWTQLLGILFSCLLIYAMGALVMVMMVAAIALGIVVYFSYARDKTRRSGALFHWFERLGQFRFPGLDAELRQIMKEKGPRGDEQVGEVFSEAIVLDIPSESQINFPELAHQVADRLADQLGCASDALHAAFLEGAMMGNTPTGGGVGLPHARLPGLDHPALAVVRVLEGLDLPPSTDGLTRSARVQMLFFLVSPEEEPGRHLRLLARIASYVEQPAMMAAWLYAKNEAALRELLVQGDDEDFHVIIVTAEGPAAELLGKQAKDVELPEDQVISFVRRGKRVLLPDPKQKLQEGDVLILKRRGEKTPDLDGQDLSPGE